MAEQNFLIFTKKQTTYLTAGFVFVLALTFTIGYVIGQRKTLTDFTEQLKEDSFADNIKYSMYAAYKSTPQSADIDSNADLDIDGTKEGKADLETVEKKEIIAPDAEPAKNVLVGKKYYAQLCGFGNSITAKKFVDRVKKLGIPVIIQEKKGRSKKGNALTWYQVVTPAYEDKQLLLKDVEKVQLSEKLQKVKLVEE